MEITTKLREKFCKDCGLPIKIYEEPYFSERISLYDFAYDSINCWDRFNSTVIKSEKYPTTQDYFDHYNQVKDNAIDYIKQTEGYQEFNSMDMNNYSVSSEYRGISTKDIFKNTNDGKIFISIDMIKANFSSLHYFDSTIFGSANYWEQFLYRFTDNSHILNSKYIRQVILGNCNPKRQITYEKYLMSEIIDIIYQHTDLYDKIVFFSNDEIVLDVTELDNPSVREIHYIRTLISRYAPDILSMLKIEMFTLHKIKDASGFYKKVFESDNIRIEFKCVDSHFLPQVIRKMKGEEIQESDKFFIFEGHLAKFLN